MKERDNNFQILINELKMRGIIKDITNEQKISKLKTGDGVYIGFDPSAISLHLGNYIQIAILRRFAIFGIKPFAVIGGATGMIGDPSGKSDERYLLDEKNINKNKKAILKQLQNFEIEVIDNLDFYKNMSMISFLRDVGKHLNVNYMINKEIVKRRLDSGISFTEFSYQLIQGWDFKILHDKHNVKIQIGGSDQWGNITAGVELIRKTTNQINTALGMTTNLLTTSSGKKFGKSENNALWLDKTLTSPYDLYQYLFNSDDQNVEKFLKWLTFLSLPSIEDIMEKHQQNSHLRHAQKYLAYEVVKDIHGKEEADIAVRISNIFFGEEKIVNISNQEFIALIKHLPVLQFKNDSLLNFLVNNKIVVSKREGRYLMSHQAIELNGQIIDDENYLIKNKPFKKNYSILKKGKKSYFLIKHG